MGWELLIGVVIGGALVFFLRSSPADRLKQAEAKKARALEAAEREKRRKAQYAAELAANKQKRTLEKEQREREKAAAKEAAERRKAAEAEAERKRARDAAAEKVLRKEYNALAKQRKTEATARTAASRDAAIAEVVDSGILGSITSFEIQPYRGDPNTSEITIDWVGDGETKLTVIKQNSSPLTNDIKQLRKMMGRGEEPLEPDPLDPNVYPVATLGKDERASAQKTKTLAKDITLTPVHLFDQDKNLAVIYYAWLERPVAYTTYRPQPADPVSTDFTEGTAKYTHSWGLTVCNTFASTTPAAPTAASVPVDGFTDGLALALSGVVEQRARRDKMDDFVDKFVAEHGLEDDEEELAAVAEQFLAQHEKRLKNGG